MLKRVPKNILILLVWIFSWLCVPVSAQSGKVESDIGFNDFIQAVIDGNIGLASQKFNVEIADAAIAVAGLSPDPTITLGYNSYELSRFRLPASTGITLNYLLEHPAKRTARVSVAEADKSLAQAQLTEYVKTLRVDAISWSNSGRSFSEMLMFTLLYGFGGVASGKSTKRA